MLSKLLTIVPLLAMYGLPLVRADCQLSNVLEEDEEGVEDREALCKPQGEDSWTFAMDVSNVAVPTFDGDNPFAGVAGTKAFVIYDNACNRKGVYSPDNEGNDCGIPYTIKDNFLEYVITVNRINWDIGGGDFKFAYGAGEYMIGENGAECNDISEGLHAEVGCKTAFPINGNGS